MPGLKEVEKANMPVRRPSADLRLCVRPRTSIKIREYFHTLGGAATLKLGADYVFDASKPEMHSLLIKTSLKDTWVKAKILYSAGEVTLAKNLWLDGRTRVNLWCSIHLPTATPAFGFKITPFRGTRSTNLERPNRPNQEPEFSPYSLPPLRFRNKIMLANTPFGVQLDSSLEFFPHVAYSTNEHKVGIGTLQACLEQLNIVLYLHTSNVIPKSLLSIKMLSPIGSGEEGRPSRQAEKGWQDVKKGTEDIWANARKRSKKAKECALRKSEQTISNARNGIKTLSFRVPEFHPVQALLSSFYPF